MDCSFENLKTIECYRYLTCIAITVFSHRIGIALHARLIR